MNTHLELAEAETKKWLGDRCRNLRFSQIMKGGSSRRFYRAEGLEEGALPQGLIVIVTDDAEESARYARIAEFLLKQGVRVPMVYRWDAGSGTMWMGDFGEEDLLAKKGMPDQEARYLQTMREVSKIHQIPYEKNEYNLDLLPPFDPDMYRWEQEYFFLNALRVHYGLDGKMVDALEADEELRELTYELAELPRCFVHRDFQSQNVMLIGDGVGFIDFQGLRAGLPGYDFASLVHDPYVQFPWDKRMELLETYIRKEGVEWDWTLFHKLALQRLMQCLGAYGFLGYEKGKVQFREFFTPAMISLKQTLEEIKGMKQLRNVLELL